MNNIEELTRITAEYGVIVTKAKAAKMLNKTGPRIAQMVKEGKLEEIEFLETKHITFRSIIKLEKEYNKMG